MLMNNGLLILLILLLMYTFGENGNGSTENITLIVLALAFLISSNGCNNLAAANYENVANQ